MYHLDNRCNIFLKQIHPVFVNFPLFVTFPASLQKKEHNMIKNIQVAPQNDYPKFLLGVVSAFYVQWYSQYIEFVNQKPIAASVITEVDLISNINHHLRWSHRLPAIWRCVVLVGVDTPFSGHASSWPGNLWFSPAAGSPRIHWPATTVPCYILHSHCWQHSKWKEKHLQCEYKLIKWIVQF